MLLDALRPSALGFFVVSALSSSLPVAMRATMTALAYRIGWSLLSLWSLRLYHANRAQK